MNIILRDLHLRRLFRGMGSIVTNRRRPSWRVVKFYNGRGTAERWIKEAKNAANWTRLSCHGFVDNQVWLSAPGGFAVAYNLGNFLRPSALPPGVSHWSLTTIREKLVKIGAEVIVHAGYVICQMAEVNVPKWLFRVILSRFRRLRIPQAAPR